MAERSSTSEPRGFRFAQRELLFVLLLSAANVAAFFGTRAVAAWDRRLSEAAAEEAYLSGQRALAAGKPEAAAALFRSALVRDRDRRTYALALADALVKSAHADQALQVLTAQRERAPEDAEVNLRLGRLAAASGDLEQAERYYHNAIYGLWSEEQPIRAQGARVELVRLLLARDDRSAAQAELMAAGTTSPGGPFDPLTAAQLFEAAGDDARARTEFLQALKGAPSDPVALAGAGRTSFAQQDYGAALSYFAAAQNHGDHSEETASLDALARMVLEDDPLAPGLSSRERNRRIQVGLQQASKRIQECAGQSADAQAALEPFAADLTRLLPLFEANTRRRPEGSVVEAVETIVRSETAAVASCGEARGLDEALILIGRKHGVASK